jgi:predicted MFS family arabinose efflux permease
VSFRFDPQRRNVLLLALCQGIFVCGQTTLIFIGGLIGFALAADKSLATLPISAVILGNAIMTIPASLFMRRVGRRAGFMTGATVGISGMLLSALAVYLANFWLLVAGAIFVGFYNAFCQYYRFAAADTADEDFRPKAISLVLAGGVVAGVLGPSLATFTRDLLTPWTYLASYLAVGGLTLVALLLVSMVRIPRLSVAELKDSGRPLPVIARQPRFMAAVAASMIAYGVMSLLMTATPLAMIACGFEHKYAGYVIQWHVIGMFAPSFFTGSLIKRFGLQHVMLVGAIILVACLVTAMAGVDFENFWVGLLLLGVGWNFLFIGGTTMLTAVHTPSERGKVQAMNDFLVFGATATSSFMSGKLLADYGWATVNMVAVPFVVVAVLLTVWLALPRNNRAAAG